MHNLQEFQRTLSETYIFQSRPNAGPQAMGTFSAFFEVVLGISLRDFLLGAVTSGIAWDLIKFGGETFFLRPLFKALDLFQQSNPQLDYTRSIFRFNDVDVTFVTPTVAESHTYAVVFEHLATLRDLLFDLSEESLREIVIPVRRLQDSISGSVYLELQPFEQADLLGFWGLAFHLGLSRRVLDVRGQTIIDQPWGYFTTSQPGTPHN